MISRACGYPVLSRQICLAQPNGSRTRGIMYSSADANSNRIIKKMSVDKVAFLQKRMAVFLS